MKKPESDHQPAGSYAVHPIGSVRRSNDRVFLEIRPEYRAALQELEGFSHLQVLWWFNRFDTEGHRQMMEMGPPFDAPRLGIFASKAPMRPNPIAVSVVKPQAVDREGGIIDIPRLDAFDGSPVLDIKPYLPCYDRVASPKVPDWASLWPEWMPEEGVKLDWMPE